MTLKNRCKFYSEFKCIEKQKKDKCEFERFLADFIIYLGKQENINYYFSGCPDAVLTNSDRKLDLVVTNEDKSKILLIEAKSLQLTHVAETNRASENFGNQMIKYSKVKKSSIAERYLEKYGVELVLNETLIKGNKIIEGDFNNFINQIFEIMYFRDSIKQECIHLYYDGEKFTEDSKNVKKMKYPNKNKIEKFKNLNIGFKNMYDVRKRSSDLLLEKFPVFFEDNCEDLEILKCMSNDNVEVVINAKTLPTEPGNIIVGKKIHSGLELNILIENMISKYLEQAYQKFKEFDNSDTTLRKILFFNIDYDVNQFSSFIDDVIKYIQKYIEEYDNIDEIWMEYYEYKNVIESIDYYYLENPIKQYRILYKRNNVCN